jgi:hypothetical protein
VVVVSLLTSPLGLPAARVDTHAGHSATFGPEACRLAEVAGLALDPWQQQALDRWCAVDVAGKWVHFEVAELVSRQNGKGSIAEARVLAGLLLFGEKLIMWSAHEFKTAVELFLRIKQLIRVLIEVGELDEGDIKVIHANGEQGFERLSTGQRIKFIARSAGSGRGFSGDLNLIDEAYAYTRLQQSALMPTMSARPNPQIVYLSSPPLTGDTGEILYQLRRRGDPAAPRGPQDPPWSQDPSLAYRDWGEAGNLDELDGVDLDDVDLWRRTNPACPHRISIEFIGRERRSMSPEDFARERCGIWPREITGAGGVIPAELWRELAAEPERPADVAYAIVVSYDRTRTAIAAVGRRVDGRLQASVVDHRPGTHWVVERAAQLRKRWAPIGIACQDKGPSGTLLAPLAEVGITPPEDRDSPTRGDLAVPWAHDVGIAYGMTMDALTERRLVHVDEPPLNVAVGSAQTRPLGGGTTWDYRASGAELLQAVSLGVWLHETWGPLVTVDRDPVGVW